MLILLIDSNKRQAVQNEEQRHSRAVRPGKAWDYCRNIRRTLWTFWKGLQRTASGDTGADFMEVQRNLQLKGYYKDELSGYYSVATERALNDFQKDNKLPISNVIDAKMYAGLGIVLCE